MARYDYRCTRCNTVFEVEHPMTAHPDISCPACGGAAGKLFCATGIVFEGNGFYNTDERAGAARASAPKPDAAAKAPAAKKDAGEHVAAPARDRDPKRAAAGATPQARAGAGRPGPGRADR